VKFQVIPISGFHFIVLTYTPTHTHRDKVIAISALPYTIGTHNEVSPARWLAQLTACAFNQLGHYASSPVAGPTVTKNSALLPSGVITIANIHCANSRRMARPSYWCLSGWFSELVYLPESCHSSHY